MKRKSHAHREQNKPAPTNNRQPVSLLQTQDLVKPVTRPKMPVIMAKMDCACGGTCPGCQKKLGIQAKLRVSQPNDPLEREADQVADQVMRMSMSSPPKIGSSDKGTLMRSAQEEEKREDDGPQIQRMAKGGTTPAASTHHAQVGQGRPLSGSERSFFEPRFRRDFSQVRIHNESRAHAMADSLQAKAYTLGNHIVFNRGEFSPETLAGRHLLAHELTHVVQQEGKPQAVQRTVKSALDLIADQRKHIKMVADRLNIDPMLIARVLFQENRNDGNITRFNDYSWYNDYNFTGIGGPEIKNAGADYSNVVFGGEGSVGVGEMRIPTAHMLLKKYFPDQEWKFTSVWGEETVTTDELGSSHINALLTEGDKFAITMTGIYLHYLSQSELNQQGDDPSIGPSQETLLKDYNRGLSGHERGVVSTVGRRSGPYVPEIEHALKSGIVAAQPPIKDDHSRRKIYIRNKMEKDARVYVAFHSERNNESAWFNNDFSSYWDIPAGERWLLTYEGETVRSDRIRVKFETREGPSGNWGNMTYETTHRTGFGPGAAEYTLNLIPS